MNHRTDQGSAGRTGDTAGGRTGEAGPSRATCCAPADLGATAAVEALAPVFKALADPTRLRVLAMLARTGGSLCACEIEAAFDLSQPTVSHHLRLLRRAGLVTAERRGTWMHYTLVRERMESWLHTCEESFGPPASILRPTP